MLSGDYDEHKDRGVNKIIMEFKESGGIEGIACLGKDKFYMNFRTIRNMQGMI